MNVKIIGSLNNFESPFGKKKLLYCGEEYNIGFQ